MKTKTYQVYIFDELSKEAKEYAKQKYYESEDYCFLESDLTERLRELAPYWKETKLAFSLSCCQGDGLSFSGTLALMPFLNKFFHEMRRKEVLCEYIYKIYSKGNKGHYTYASKNDIDIEYNYQSGKEHKRLEKLSEAVLECVQEDYLDVCKKLEKEGYGIIEYRMTDEEFSEYCDANEYEFTEDGKLDF